MRHFKNISEVNYVYWQTLAIRVKALSYQPNFLDHNKYAIPVTNI